MDLQNEDQAVSVAEQVEQAETVQGVTEQVETEQVGQAEKLGQRH